MFAAKRDREDRRRDEPKRRERAATHHSLKQADPNALQLIKIIGEGSEGSCELHQRIGDGKLVVCKKAHIIRKNMIQGNTPREVKILRDTLRPHDRIINLISYTFDKKCDELHTYYDYCAGGDLQSYLYPDTGSSEAFIWHVFRQMAEALAYLHTGYARSDPNKSGKMPHSWRPVVHCDIKPDNIFLRTPRSAENLTPDIVLGDFGLAVIGGDKDGTEAACYQPPEFPYNTPAGDVWALGALIHRMGHGEVPVEFKMPKRYRGDDLDWLTDPCSKRVKPLPLCYSEALSRNMLDCLKLRADERVGAYDLLRHIRRDDLGRG